MSCSLRISRSLGIKGTDRAVTMHTQLTTPGGTPTSLYTSMENPELGYITDKATGSDPGGLHREWCVCESVIRRVCLGH